MFSHNRSPSCTETFFPCLPVRSPKVLKIGLDAILEVTVPSVHKMDVLGSSYKNQNSRLDIATSGMHAINVGQALGSISLQDILFCSVKMMVSFIIQFPFFKCLYNIVKCC